MRIRAAKNRDSGMALLVVLFVVMSICVLSIGFIARSDIELLCGQNTVLKAQTDYLAESGLEHARGVIMYPQDTAGNYMSGKTGMQLDSGSEDYYDFSIDQLDSCSFKVVSRGYRMKDGAETGESILESNIRLDPVIAVWVGSTWTTEAGAVVNGDVVCNGNLQGLGRINGDAFASGSVDSGMNLTGSANSGLSAMPIPYPFLNINLSSKYYIEENCYSVTTIGSSSHPSGSFTPTFSNPKGVRYHNGNLTLKGNTSIHGSLIVTGDLIVTGVNNIVESKFNFPGVVVGGDLIFADSSVLDVKGLVIVMGEVRGAGYDGDFVRFNVIGGLFIKNNNINGLEKLTNSIIVSADPAAAAIEVWPSQDSAWRWNSSGGAFYKSINRR